MSENLCRGICGYYDVKAEFRKSQNDMFKKYCSTCNLELVLDILIVLVVINSLGVGNNGLFMQRCM